MMKILKSKRGEGDYISVAFLVIVVVLMLALIVNVFSAVIAKQKIDQCVAQMTRQIQLTGRVSDDTQALFDTMMGDIAGVTVPTYEVYTTYLSDTKIQLGTMFTVKISAVVKLGGFGVVEILLTLIATSAGVSEVYHK